MDNLSPEILRRAAQGDIEAFEQIYRTYAPFVFNVAMRMAEAREDAEEIAQEVFIIVHRKLNSFMFRSSLKTWMYRITVNCTINFLNKRNRDHKGKVEFDEAFGYDSGPNEVEKNIEAQDNSHKVQRLLDILNPEERACIVLRNIEGLSYQQIAQSLNVNLNTVRTRLKRAREKMLKRAKETVTDEL